MLLLSASSFVHVMMVWGEVSLTHATAHARVAIWEMTGGRYRRYFRIGLLLSILGGLLPLLPLYRHLSIAHMPPDSMTLVGVAGAPLALLGMMLYEHAYVQAGQSVPLA